MSAKPSLSDIPAGLMRPSCIAFLAAALLPSALPCSAGYAQELNATERSRVDSVVIGVLGATGVGPARNQGCLLS